MPLNSRCQDGAVKHQIYPSEAIFEVNLKIYEQESAVDDP